MEEKLACSNCGLCADVLVVYKKRVLCFICFARQHKKLASHLVDYLEKRCNIQAVPAPPAEEPFGSIIGPPVASYYVPSPGAPPQDVKIAKVKKTRASVTVGSVEWIESEK